MTGPVDLERLERELGRVARALRPGATVRRVRRTRRMAPSSWAVEDVDLELDDGTTLPLVWKDLAREAPGSGARRVKPARIADTRREPWTYEHVLGPSGLGPACRGSVTDPDAGVHWLFLERVDGTPLHEVGDPAVWAAAAAWLGRFHARFAGRPPRHPVLLAHDRRLHRRWLERALARSGRADATPAGRHRSDALRRMGPVHGAAVATVLADTPTLLHGEFYPANILVTGTSLPAIVPVDWEMAGPGPAVLDLAALTSGGWSDAERRDLTTAYADARAEAGAPCPPPDRLEAALEAARLLLAVQWLGWADDLWVPPADLHTDWFEEAVRSAARLTA